MHFELNIMKGKKILLIILLLIAITLLVAQNLILRRIFPEAFGADLAHQIIDGLFFFTAALILILVFYLGVSFFKQKPKKNKNGKELISIVAHQLKTPLASLKWSLKMLKNQEVGKLTPEQIEFVSKIYEHNEKIITFVNDYLDLTRIEDGEVGYRFQNEAIESLIKELISNLEGQAKEKNINLSLAIPEKPLPKVRIDAFKIRLAIQNLIENAICYTPKGGDVTVLINYDKMNVEITVRDTGIGIPKKELNSLFTKFFRASNAKKTGAKGTGLGLYITKNIVEKHKGKIWVESREGKGSVFRISLPI